MMHRNLDGRVELMFPVEDPNLLGRIHRDIIDNALRDTQKIRWLVPDGTYVRRSGGECLYDSQNGLVANYFSGNQV
jgi:polyphosphate kinase